MFENIESFGRQLLIAIYLIICTIIAAKISFAIGIQYYYLIDVVTFVPATRFYTYDSGLRRLECLHSTRGGKRPKKGNETYDFNPCFCDRTVADCYDKLTGAFINGTCPMNGSAQCITRTTKVKLTLHISAKRNCEGGQGRYCTKNEPCFPCDIDSVVAFNTSRCRMCTTDYTGDCNFIPDVGPYCFEKVDSKKVVPCKKCCTENTGLVIRNGTCY
eukprot:gene1647-1743_t